MKTVAKVKTWQVTMERGGQRGSFRKKKRQKGKSNGV